MKIFFIVPYPLHEAPSQRFRFEQYFELLRSAGHTYKAESFLSNAGWNIVYKPGKTVTKTLHVLWGFAKRCSLIARLFRYDFIFIHRESTPFGPPVIEWFIASILRKKIIYDFDDAIWRTDKMRESPFEKIVRCRRKVSLICKWSYKVSCGNQYLCNYASQYNNSVILNPTTIDTPNLNQRVKTGTDEIIVGWSGSHSTLKYLNVIEPVIQLIEQKYSFVKFLVIANKKPMLQIRSLRFLPWRKDTEIEDLKTIDIGIMPLPDDEWSKGKCGFKALQYMALGIPPVISPVGVNGEIVSHGENGFLCSSEQEWKTALELLIESPELRKKIGERAQLKVLEHYSTYSNSSNFLSLFQ